MAYTFVALVLLFVVVTASVQPRLQKDGSPSKRRHTRHYHVKMPHRHSGKFEKDFKVPHSKNLDEFQKHSPPYPYEKQVLNDPQEMHHRGEEPEVVASPEVNTWDKYIPASCRHDADCNMDNEISKFIRIMQIKEQILSQTGLKAPPNMTGVIISINPVLQKLIANLNRQNEEPKLKNESQLMYSYADDPNIKKKKIFVPATKGSDSVHIPSGKLHFFNLSSEHPSSIEQAILHIYIKPISGFVPKDKVAQISFFKVEPPKYPHDYHRLRSVPSINSVVTVPYSMSGNWEKVDIYTLVREWLSNHSMNLGFVISVTVDGHNIDIDTAEEDPSHAPMLELDVKEEKNDRQKRYVGNRVCSEDKQVRECCRYPLIVDFTEYEYDFIVAPKKYVANYCKGECPFLYAHKLPHSTVLQQMFPNTSSYHHGPCCGASDLAPLKMVYYDGSKIKIETIDDMVVIHCSCK